MIPAHEGAGLRARRALVVCLFSTVAFTSAALLFLVQPLFARMLLPRLGGAPAVWNTAMVFYQGVLLAGYAYAHVSVTRLGVRRQAAWHFAVLLAAVLVLPLAIPAGWLPPVETSPIPWLLAAMAVGVGLPFFAVAATGPLLQTWYSASAPPRARDPHFLYAASNLGSVLALVAYPWLIEPRWGLAEQSRLWAWDYGVFVVLLAACAAWLWRAKRSSSHELTRSSRSWTRSDAGARVRETSEAAREGITAGRRLRWVVLAFVPSSLVLGVTNYFSSDIAVVPLFWVLPLALYLLTFVLAFAPWRIFPRAVASRAFAILVVPLVLVFDMEATQPVGALMLLHLATLFVTGLCCHGELAADRPPPSRLTEFYLWVSAGGVLGGAFNALLAPLVFNSIAEYPLVLALACAVAAPAADDRRDRVFPALRAGDVVWPAVLGLATIGAVRLVIALSPDGSVRPVAAAFGAGALVCFFFSRRPVRFALGVGALLLAGVLSPRGDGKVLRAERSFFGVHRVFVDPTGKYHVLVHGVTVHGRQSLDPARRREPLAYYDRAGPAGDVFATSAGRNVGVIGLGAGELSAYARDGERWTFFEIDPVIVEWAGDPRLFTFLRDAAVAPRIVLGDARSTITREPDGNFDLLIVDAYSSDAIPLHLVTREALALYLRKLAPGGRLVFHISNRHFDLEPVFAALGRDAGLVALTRDDTRVSAADVAAGKSPSAWLVMARDRAAVAALARDARWQPSRGAGAVPAWTDDYADPLRVFRWE
jgi:spermidine synthase